MNLPFEPLPAPTPAPVQGTPCPQHPAEPVIDSCSRCGDFVCLRCAEFADGKAFCQRCKPVELPLAGLGARFAGSMLDGVAYFAIGGILYAVGMAASQEVALLLGVVGMIAAFGLNVYLLATAGQSIGKRVVGTRIVLVSGERAPLGATLFMRSIVPGLIGAIPYVGSLFGTIDACFVFSADRRCIHDLMAGTKVVLASASEHVYTP